MVNQGFAINYLPAGLLVLHLLHGGVTLVHVVILPLMSVSLLIDTALGVMRVRILLLVTHLNSRGECNNCL